VLVLSVAGFATAALARSSAAGPAVSTVITATAPAVTVPHQTCKDVLQFGVLEVFGGTATNPQPTLCPTGSKGAYKATAGFEVNGIVLTNAVVSSFPSGTFVFNPANVSVNIDGQAIINSIAKGPLATFIAHNVPAMTWNVPAASGTYPQNGQVKDLSSGFTKGKVGGFQISGDLTLSLTLAQAPGGTQIYGFELGLTATLPSIFTKTGGASVSASVLVRAANENPNGSANSVGLRLAGAQIVIGTPPAGSGFPVDSLTAGQGIRLGPVQVKYFCLSYTGIVGGTPGCSSSLSPSLSTLLGTSQACNTGTGDSWDGQIEIAIPSGGSPLQIDAVGGTRAGHFSYAAADVSGLNIPIYPAVALNELGFGVCLIASGPPTGGGLKLDGQIGLKVSDVIDGTIALHYRTTKNAVLSGLMDSVTSSPFDSLPTTWYFDATGMLSVAGASLGGAEVYIDHNAIGVTGQFQGSWTASGNVGTFLSGSATANINAAVSGHVSLTNNAFNIFANVSASASGAFNANLALGSISASASAAGNGTLAMSDFGFGACLNLSGSASGSVSIGHYVGWPYYGYVTFGSASVSANFSFDFGVADGFVPQNSPNVPVGYQHGWHLFWGACDTAAYQDVNLTGHVLTALQLDGVTASPDRIPLPVAKGQRGQVISVIGKDGPPKITITAPNGEKLSTPKEPKGKPAVSPHMIMFVNTASNQTFIVLGKPPAGTYEIALEPGSTPIVAVHRADVLPKPRVTARITSGNGRTRFLHYSITQIPGQSVQFFEQGSLDRGPGGGFGALGPVRGVTERTGVIRFSSARGPRGERAIRALVSENGLPRAEFTVATYSAPQ
jgi:hypothetical protein